MSPATILVEYFLNLNSKFFDVRLLVPVRQLVPQGYPTTLPGSRGVSVPKKVADTMFHSQKLDNVGAARYADDLEVLNEVMSVPKVI